MPFPISAIHAHGLHVKTFHAHHTISLNHSMALNDSDRLLSAFLFITISFAVASPYTFLNAQYAFFISLNSQGIDAIVESRFSRIHSTSCWYHCFTDSFAVISLFLRRAFINWFISSASVIHIFLSKLSASFSNSFAHSGSSVCTVSLIAFSRNFLAVQLISICISCPVNLFISFQIFSISSLIAAL